MNQSQEPRRSNLPLVLAGIAIAAAIAGALILVSEMTRDDPESTPVKATVYEGVPRDGRTLGDPAAPVVVEEYGDFQCLACRSFVIDTQDELVESFVRTGAVRLEFHDFATLGEDSLAAAEAARCATDQGKFWEYHAALFARQGAENSGAFSRERLTAIANDIQIDSAVFATCLSGAGHADDVDASTANATARGVTITPTFFVNGERIEGAPDIDVLRSAIERAQAE